MNLIDSHTHLYFREQFPDASEIVGRAITTGVTHMILPGVNSGTIKPIRELHALFPDNTSMGIGLHPSDVEHETWQNELKVIADELKDNVKDYVAVGEIGIDLHWDTTTLDLQQQAFEQQLNLAKELDLPAILHSRDAFAQTHEVIGKEFEDIPMVFHSYSGDVSETERIMALYPNVYFGINGIVTFKNAKIKEVLNVIPSDRLLIETDAPYLAPTPHRGKTNESAFLVHTAQFIADYLGVPVEKIASSTTDNTKRLFRIA